MARSIVIYVSGVDGSGKTTISTILEYQLRKLGLPVIRLWFRFPYLALYPLLLLARKIGLTKVFKCKDKVFTVHFFELVAHLYMILFLLDFTIYYILRIEMRTLLPLVLIVDRGPLDNLIDMATDVGRAPSSFIAKYFMKLCQRGITIITKADFETLVKRRCELACDPKSRLRYTLYKLVLLRYLQRSRSYVTVDTERPLNENLKLIRMLSAVIKEWYGAIGYGKKFQNPYIKAFFANRWVILLTNWMIQGSLIADPFENLIRITIDITLPAIALLLNSNVMYVFTAFIVAHTVNYIVNSNCMHVFRFFTKVDPDKCLVMVLRYLNRQEMRHVDAVVIFGSFVRGEQRNASDIDIRILRRKNSFKSIIESYIFLTKLRMFALKNRVPLDVFMHTREQLCKIVKQDELAKIYVIPETKLDEIISYCLELKGIS